MLQHKHYNLKGETLSYILYIYEVSKCLYPCIGLTLNFCPIFSIKKMQPICK